MLPKLQDETNFNICRIQPADFTGLAKLYADSIRANPAGFIQDMSFHGPIQAICQHYLNTDGEFLVGKMGSRVIGMAGLRRLNETGAELCKLHVHSDYQGCGYGKQLIFVLLACARKLAFQEVELHVTATQKAALGLYVQLGFIQTHRQTCRVALSGKAHDFDTIYMRLKI